MADLQRRLAVARGDEPADLVVRGGRVLSVFTREWLEADVAIVDGFDRRPRRLRGRGDARRLRPLRSCPASSTRTCTSSRRSSSWTSSRGCAAARDDDRRRRPARDRERARHRRRALAARRVRATAARRLLHGLVVRAGVDASSRRGAPLSTGDLDALLRRRRVLGLAEMMNFPGVVAGDEHELAKLALRGRDARRRPRARRARARTLNAYAAAGIRSDHEARTHRGGSRAPARRHVAADPRGVGRAQPPGAAAAGRRVRAAPHRVLHRRPRAGAHRRGRAHQLDGARRRSRPA